MIKALVKLIAPPKDPIEPGSKKGWAAVEKELGTKLPEDFKEFVNLYGTGNFGSFYRVYNPFSSSSDSNLLQRFQKLGEQYKTDHEEDPDRFPHAVFPASPGLIPWGDDENGNYYFWLAKGKPDKWTVVSDETRGDGMQEYPVSFSEYLAKVLTKKIKPLAGEYPRKECLKFEPFPVATDPAELLFDAIYEKKDLKRVRELLDSGADANASYGGTTLLAAAVLADLAIARLLLERGANVNNRKGAASTPIFAAAQTHNIAAVRLLLDAGADVNMPDLSGRTALFSAVNGRSHEVVKMLLDAGAHVDPRDDEGRTVLYRAIYTRKPEIVRLLLDYKADVNVKDQRGETPLNYAEEFEKPEEIVGLLKKAGAK